MTYPVKWKRYKVLRDFVQNFYDSVGYKKWHEMFHFSCTDNSVTMEIQGVTFSYEWLLHIGASTKTGSSDEYAGYFGEGFKIATLCAVRDLSWKIEMSSGDWKLTPVRIAQNIDKTPLEMLAYDVQKVSESEGSCSILSSLSQEDIDVFKMVLVSFYYPENPIIGTKIYEDEKTAVYTRSKKKNSYPMGLPFTTDYGRKGAVFCAYQLMGSNPFDLVVCRHDYNKEDRERNDLYFFDVINVFESIAYRLDSEASMIVLEKMRRYWNSNQTKKVDISSWSHVIRFLVINVADSEKVKEAFAKKYPHLICLRKITSVHEQNKRAQAKAWLTRQKEKYSFVQESFTSLGYKTLEEECESHGGFVLQDDADKNENQGFEILENLVQDIYPSFFDMRHGLPKRKIIANDEASYVGMASLYKKSDISTNNRGIYVRYNIAAIYLKRTIFSSHGFYNAVSTYVHEMCHAFGGDSSNSFSLGLTLAMEILLANYAKVEKYCEEWTGIFA